MRYKDYIQKACVALSTVLAVSSCVPEMDLNNPSEFSTDTYYSTASQLEAAIAAAYQQLVGTNQGGYGRYGYVNFLAPGDDMERTYKWTDMYQDTYTTPASNSEIMSSWEDFYTGVFAANLVIEKVTGYEGTDITTDTRNRMLGEGYFLRGLYYMQLVQLFGETIPYWDHPIASADEYYPGNSEPGALYQLIVSDFTKAAELLPLRSKLYADASNKGRATKGAAQAYLARAYLYRPILERGQSADFSAAATQLAEVINSGEYSLMECYNTNFVGWSDPTYDNNAESVFEVQMYDGTDWLGGDVSDSWRWLEVGCPDGVGGFWWNIAPNQKTYDEFEEGDPRKYMTLWCEDGAYFTESDGTVLTWEEMKGRSGNIHSLHDGQDLYAMRKYCPDDQDTMNVGDDDCNDRLMRYADVLLMYAECLSELGNDSKAVTDPTGPKYYIQMIRDRANNVVPTEQSQLWYATQPGTLPTVDELMASGAVINGISMTSVKNVIQHERYVELCGEYLRYWDLLRWGMADSSWLQPLKNLGWSESAMFYPFPEDELSNNPNLTGNSAN